MTNRDLAEKIYKDLNKRGADLGNASIGIISKTLDENKIKNCSIPVIGQSEQLKCDNCKCTPTVIYHTSSGRFCEACRPVTL
jgi:hypothetical protein